MNTFQISCFLAVAEHLNFARAAEQLHVTQPAVTQQIHSLEKKLGVSLFARKHQREALDRIRFLMVVISCWEITEIIVWTQDTGRIHL